MGCYLELNTLFLRDALWKLLQQYFTFLTFELEGSENKNAALSSPISNAEN